MPIKWSAVKVYEAMDDVERQINLAESFLTEAKIRAEAARTIADLPQHVDQRLVHLITDIERIDNVRSTIEAVRECLKHGSQQSLI